MLWWWDVDPSRFLQPKCLRVPGSDPVRGTRQNCIPPSHRFTFTAVCALTKLATNACNFDFVGCAGG